MRLTAAPPTQAPRTHQALYRRWRAQTFGEIVGQEAVVQTLRNAVRTNQVAHALLFVGPRGTGKTSMARIVAKALNCTNLVDGEPDDTCEACVSIREGRALDVIEMDAASNNKVDDIREFLPRVATVPSGLRRKVFIVDEVQRIKEGWDLLLKTLEEPPDHVAFIFCTTDASQVRPAVLSRIQRFDFRPLTVAQIEGKLRRVLDAEGRAADDDAVELVARLAAGGMRDAESMLDQLLTSTSDRLTADDIRELLGMVESATVLAFVDALVTHDSRAGMRLLQQLEDHGRDVRAFLNQVVDALRDEIVADLGGSRRHAPDDLATAARRLTSIDPAYMGPGGLRFQLELALLESTSAGDTRARSIAVSVPSAASAPSAPASAASSPAATSAQPAASASAPTSVRSAASASSQPAASAPPPVVATPAAASVRSVSAPSESPTPSAQARGGASSAPPGAAGSSAAQAAPAAPARSGSSAPSARSSPPRDASASSAPASDPRAPVGPAGAAAVSEQLEDLVRRWPEIVGWISQFPAVKPLILACRPIAVDGNVITLGFPESQAFYRDIAERRRSTLEEGVGRILGRTVAVRCVATNLELAPMAPAADADRLLVEARRIFAEDLLDIDEVS